jgi:hypothetical protein
MGFVLLLLDGHGMQGVRERDSPLGGAIAKATRILLFTYMVGRVGTASKIQIDLLFLIFIF